MDRPNPWKNQDHPIKSKTRSLPSSNYIKINLTKKNMLRLTP